MGYIPSVTWFCRHLVLSPGLVTWFNIPMLRSRRVGRFTCECPIVLLLGQNLAPSELHIRGCDLEVGQPVLNEKRVRVVFALELL
jgi:hypothetical protein